MATTLAVLVAGIVLLFAGRDAAFVAPLTPVWSKPLGKGVRLVGVEEYGRCILFADNGAIQVVLPSGETMWSWPYSKINRYLNPRDVAVSHDCNAIALLGDASYKYAWIVERDGGAVSIPLPATPADVAFDRTGSLVAIGAYGGSVFLYSRDGHLQWQRNVSVSIATGLVFNDDNTRIVLRGGGGVGVVTVAGQVEWSRAADRLKTSGDLNTLVISEGAADGTRRGRIVVADALLSTLWTRPWDSEAFVSATGDRLLIESESGLQLVTRDGDVVARYAEYESALALSDDGARAWLRLDDLGVLHCVNDRGSVLATIEGDPVRDVRISRDFSQVLIVKEKDLTPVAVERYVVPEQCKVKS